jgi:hypothetical protein
VTTYPRATYRPVTNLVNDPEIQPVGVILHVSGSESKSLYPYFNGPSNGVESHLHIAYDGTVEQYRDLDHEADANYRGNSWIDTGGRRLGFLSVETQGLADGVWTDAQIDGIQAFLSNSWSNARGKVPLALDTIVPTTTGPKMLGDIAVGDQVYDEAGLPASVLDVHDVQPSAAYRMTFDDGAEVVASDTHLWSGVSLSTLRQRLRHRVMVRGVRAATANVKTVSADWPTWTEPQPTAEVAGRVQRWGIPLAQPVGGSDAELPLDPYILGLWLGDGGSRDGVMCAGHEDFREVERVFVEAGFPTGMVQRRPNVVIWRPLGLEKQLRLMGVLGNKHVPAQYITASAEQRAALLAGLLDSDGTISASGNRVEFSNKNEGLSDAVAYLAASLGQKPSRAKKTARLNGVEHGVAHRVSWRATRQLFRLGRKAARYAESPTLRSQVRVLRACVPTAPVPMRCLTVDSPNSLFCVTERFLPTHNCPGPNRIRQFNDLLVPWMARGGRDVAEKPPRRTDPKPLEDELTPDDRKWIDDRFGQLEKAVRDNGMRADIVPVKGNPANPTFQSASVLQYMFDLVRQMAADVSALKEKTK